MHHRVLCRLVMWAWPVLWLPWTLAYAASDQAPESLQEAQPQERDVIYVPTPQHVVDLMLGLADVRKTDLLYDLGCGDGRIVVAAAQKYGCRAVGVDIDPERVRESRDRVKAAGLEHLVTIEQRDIFQLDLSQADVVTLYLLPHLNVRLIPQLEQMKPGSRIVSHDFDMAGVEPDAEVTVLSRQYGRREIYLWTVPLQKTTPSALKADGRTPQAGHGSPPGWLSADAAYGVPFLVAGGLGLLALLVWLLSQRLGVIRMKVTLERTRRSGQTLPKAETPV